RTAVSGRRLPRHVSDARAGGLGRRLPLGRRAGRLPAGRPRGIGAELRETRDMSDSKRLFEAATRLIPGGVNSPVRAFKGVGGEPFFVARGEGARIWDVDGRSYLDFLGSWGPLVLGHAPKTVVEAIGEAARRGTSYGAPTVLEVEMAEAITAAYPSIELVRLVSSGTEAAMSAIRVARGATGRLLLIKFDGCYHGHADSLLVKAGSGGATFSIPDSAGVPAPLAALTLTAPFNDLDAVRALFRARGDEIAGVIVEPVAGNMGVVAPLPGFLEGLREITHAHGALLIFDEVITGFRVAYGGAQARVPLTVNRVGSMLTAFFCDGPVTDYASAKRADTARYARYFHAMRERGVFLAPSQFEAAFVSLAHTEADLELAARAVADALASLSR